MDTKSIFKSKTIWFNVLTIIVTIATIAGYTPDQNIANQVTGGLLAISPIINIFWRMITKQPVSLFSQSSGEIENL